MTSNPVKDRLLATLRWNTHMIESCGTDGMPFKGQKEAWGRAVLNLKQVETELSTLHFPDRWRSMLVEQPEPGQLIVKYWRTAKTTWSGVYVGGPKDSGFDLWYPLRLPPEI